MSRTSADLRCPRCQSHLDKSGDSQWRCASCGGTLMRRTAVVALLDAAEEGTLLAARAMGYRTSTHDEITMGGALPAEDVRYLRCPICTDLMLRTRVLRNDAAVVDVCVLHALWFDVGELERTVAGLAREGPGCRAALGPLIAEHFRRERGADHTGEAQ